MRSRHVTFRLTCFLMVFAVSTPSIQLYAGENAFLRAPASEDESVPPNPNDDQPTVIDGDNEPIIKLPALPPRRTFPLNPNGGDIAPNPPIRLPPVGPGNGNNNGNNNNGNNPNNPNNQNGNNNNNNNNNGPKPPVLPNQPNNPINRLVMNGIERSAFPQISCPLIDNRPYKDIVTAVTNLTNVVKPSGQCQNNSDMQKIAAEVFKMKDAGLALQKVWNNPSVMSENPKATADFQNNLTSIIAGMNMVTTSLQQNSLIDSACGRETLSAGTVLVALSDLASSLTPVALVGASLAGASVGSILPYAIGVAGVGSVVKIVNNMYNANTLDMSRPDQRLAVLQNICEFSRIQERVDFVNSVQAKDIAALTGNISGRREKDLAQLRQQFPERVMEIVKIRKGVESQLSRTRMAYQKALNEFKAQREIIDEANDKTRKDAYCSFAQTIQPTLSEPNEFPLSAVEGLKASIGMQVRMLPAQNNTMMSEKRARSKLLAKTPDELQANEEDCAERGQAYFTAISSVMLQWQRSIQRLSMALDSQLRKDPEYREYRKHETQLMNELETMNRVAELMKRANMSNAVIDRAEMLSQMRNLKGALFSKPQGLPFVRGSSPAMAWLHYTHDQHRKSVSQFNAEMRELTNAAYQMAIAAPKSGPKSSDTTAPYQKWEEERQAVATLSYITPALFEGRDMNTIDRKNVMCRKLKNAWFAWQAAMDHLLAEDFFCRHINKHFDTNTEKNVKLRCETELDPTGRILRNSELVQTAQALVDRGYQDQALIVNLKIDELNCEKPDPSVMR